MINFQISYCYCCIIHQKQNIILVGNPVFKCMLIRWGYFFVIFNVSSFLIHDTFVLLEKFQQTSTVYNQVSDLFLELINIYLKNSTFDRCIKYVSCKVFIKFIELILLNLLYFYNRSGLGFYFFLQFLINSISL